MRRDAPTKAGGEQTVLQLAYLHRSRAPVVMDVGPVLALEDVAGGKVCALASRVEIRDYADTARMLDRYSPSQLIGFARRLDPGLDRTRLRRCQQATRPHCRRGVLPLWA